MKPNADLLTLVVEGDVGEVDGDVDGGHSHENGQDAVRGEEVVDDPSPDPGNGALECSNGNHELDRELRKSWSVQVQKIGRFRL